jgi:DNA-binding GntR family transcriptional regulator
MYQIKEPAYLQVRRFLLSEIAAGRYGAGDLLPSETELAKRFGVTRNTVVHGLSALVSDGRIKRIAGKGTFVARKDMRIAHHASIVKSFDEEIIERGARIEFRLFGFTRVPCPETVAEQLQIGVGEDVFRLERVQVVDDIPTIYEIRHIPIELGQRLTIDALSRLPMLTILAQSGQPASHIEGIIRADVASSVIAEKLAISPQTPILVRDLVLRDAQMTPLVSGTAIFTHEVPITCAMNKPVEDSFSKIA